MLKGTDTKVLAMHNVLKKTIKANPNVVLKENSTTMMFEMNKEEKMGSKTWVIAVANTDGDGVSLSILDGTKKDAKKFLLKLSLADKEYDEEGFDYGPEDLDDIYEEPNGSELSACSVYSDYHIEYTAKALETIERV